MGKFKRIISYYNPYKKEFTISLIFSILTSSIDTFIPFICRFITDKVINFESIWRTKQAPFYKDFITDKTMIIIDESQKIKNYKSKVTQFLNSVKGQTKYKVLLTGTPQNQQYIDWH